MVDEILIRFSVRDDGSPVIEKVNKQLGKTKEQEQALVPGLEKLKSSVTGFASANAALISVLVGVGVAIGKVVKDHIEYANSVRQLSALSGESAENTSRFIQVLDDYKLSTDDALAATRALTKEGHAPNIETLAKLSDEYLKINTVEERNEFILKNLGRGGAAWTEILQKGSKALLEQGAAIDKNLILTQKMVDQAREAEIATDNWNDTIGALKTQFAVSLLPAITDALKVMNAWIRAGQILKEEGQKFVTVNEFADAFRRAREEQDASTEAMLENADAAGTNAGALENLADSSKEAEEAAKTLSNHLQGMLSSMFAINSQQEQHKKTLEDLADRDRELAEEKKRLTLQMWEEQRAGKLTNDENLEYIQKLAEITKAQEDNARAKEEATEDNERASKQRIYDLVQEKLAADGIINTGEYEYLQNLAVQKGLVSRAAADQAIKENQLADSLVSNFARTQPAMDQTLATMQQIAGYNGTVVNFGVNFSQTGSVPSIPGGSTFRPNPAMTANSAMRARSRDSGGSGVAGTPYMIGRGAQPEMFVPDTNGTFIPNADKFGATYNVVVNNPKKETAENSIRSALKRLSFVGVAQ